MAPAQPQRHDRSAESDLIQRALRRDEAAVRAIMQAHNRRLYRLARSVVGDDWEAEDVLQEAYLRAFSKLGEFRGDSSLATWLSRIVINEALARKRRRAEIPTSQIDPPSAIEAQVIPFPLSSTQANDPERAMALTQLCQLLERAIDELPGEFRTVLMARLIEDMSIEETAELLNLRPETVKTRLHRARLRLKASLSNHIEPLFADVFPFDGKRCERIADIVVKRLAAATD